MTRRRNIEVGRWGESIAEGVLVTNHWVILERNFRSPYGEVDTIAIKGEELTFVEVKARTTTTFGMPEDAITEEKLEHLINTAEYYLQENPIPDVSWRIDVIAIIGKPGADNPQIKWFKNVHD